MQREMWIYTLFFHLLRILYNTFAYYTTVHKDVTERLVQINPSLASKARVVLDLNKSERHIRGGLATKEKYLQKQQHCQVKY